VLAELQLCEHPLLQTRKIPSICLCQDLNIASHAWSMWYSKRSLPQIASGMPQCVSLAILIVLIPSLRAHDSPLSWFIERHHVHVCTMPTSPETARDFSIFKQTKPCTIGTTMIDHDDDGELVTGDMVSWYV